MKRRRNVKTRCLSGLMWLVMRIHGNIHITMNITMNITMSY